MLQHRKLVRIVPDLVQQALRHGRADGRAAFSRRLLDRGAPLGAAQIRHQELALAQRLGQPLEARAVAEEIEPHGQHDVDARACGIHGGEQQAHEGGRLVGVAAAHALEAEDLLELVDDDQQPGRGAEVQLVRRVDQAEAGAPEHRLHAARPHRLHLGALLVGGAGPHLGLEPQQCVGELAHRPALRPERRDAPVRRVVGAALLQQLRHQAGAHQR